MPDGTYEAMFVMEPTFAAKDWAKVVEHVSGLITQHGGSVASCAKWGDRKLAYEIRGHKRGAYCLTYFKVDTQSLAKINRQSELSDLVVRHTIISIDHIPTPEEQAAAAAASAAPEKK